MIRKSTRAFGVLCCTLGTLIALFLAFETTLTWIFRYRLQQPSLRHAYALALDTEDALLIDQFTAEMSAQINSPQSLRWHPFVYWRAGPFQGKYVQIDEHGLRRTTSQADRATALKVFLFGGSTMFGAGSRDEHTIASELASQLSATGQDVNVVNYGQNGYVSAQECLTLELACQAGQIPDVVIFYDGVNDVASTCAT